ncbi:MAG: cytochrome oxidase [Deltaproteobacteria bacterium]|nr:MAG: cytochrome oxidase [Deltaproteobacteria bacterium]
MTVTIFLPSFDMSSVTATKKSLQDSLTYGRESGFSYEDPFLNGKAKPILVKLAKDPKTGQALGEKVTAYVYPAGTPFPSGLTHKGIYGAKIEQLSADLGKVDQASEEAGAVFLVREANDGTPYIENATATRGWTPQATLAAAKEKLYAGAGRTMFIREGCWWCHTLLPEETQDWQTFGRPPVIGDFNSVSPTTFGSDRKAPDLFHVGARNSSREWMTLHFFNPRLVQSHSIMPRYDYLWYTGVKDPRTREEMKAAIKRWNKEFLAYARGERIYPPKVPDVPPDSDARKLIDFVLSLK